MMKAVPPPTPEQLLARAAEHDDAAWGELYDRFAPPLFGLLKRIVPEKSQAEEILQDVFVRMAADARRLQKGNGSVSAALVMLARTLAVERIRAERHRVTPEMEPAPGPIPQSYAWIPAPTEIALVDGRRALFQRVISQLPKPQREMLDLVLFEGYSEAAMAQKLGEPVARVRAGLLAAVSFVRHRLAAVMRTWAANI